MPTCPPRAIMAAAIEGAYVDVATADEIETRYFISLVTGQVAQNMIKAFFFDLQHINSGGSRPDGYDKVHREEGRRHRRGHDGCGHRVRLGAGRYRGRPQGCLARERRTWQGYSVKLVEKGVAKGKLSQEKGDELLARITPTDKAEDFRGVDLVIEAAFESVEVKNKVFQEIEDIVEPDAILGSNTSTLPITLLANGVKRQEDFIGIHFFSPVDKMPLVEIIKGEKTSDAGAGQGHRLHAADPQDPDRRQRQPWLLHQPRHRHFHQRGSRGCR